MEALAERAMAVMEQVGAAFEMLFVDDGSRDHTPEVSNT